MEAMEKVGPIELIRVPGRAGGPCVVMLHGYGADARDLSAFSSVLAVAPGTTWIFPNGLLKVPLGNYMFGRAWFPVDIEALNLARVEGTPRDLSKQSPPELKTARDAVFQALDELKIDTSDVIFGGFSQGAMLATELALHAPKAPRGLMILSGALLDEKDWREEAAHRKGLRYFQSHGTQDEMLSLQGAKDLERLLSGAGLIGRLQTFDGGHEIPDEVVHGMNQYLQGLGLERGA